MKKIAEIDKQIAGSGKRIKNNGIFSIGIIGVMISNIINDTCSLVANNILEAKGMDASFNYQSPFMKIGANANNSNILF